MKKITTWIWSCQVKRIEPLVDLVGNLRQTSYQIKVNVFCNLLLFRILIYSMIEIMEAWKFKWSTILRVFLSYNLYAISNFYFHRNWIWFTFEKSTIELCFHNKNITFDKYLEGNSPYE